MSKLCKLIISNVLAFRLLLAKHNPLKYNQYDVNKINKCTKIMWKHEW